MTAKKAEVLIRQELPEDEWNAKQAVADLDGVAVSLHLAFQKFPEEVPDPVLEIFQAIEHLETLAEGS